MFTLDWKIATNRLKIIGRELIFDKIGFGDDCFNFFAYRKESLGLSPDNPLNTDLGSQSG